MDTRGVVNSLFGVPRALIGVIHVGAFLVLLLAGKPSRRSDGRFVKRAFTKRRVFTIWHPEVNRGEGSSSWWGDFAMLSNLYLTEVDRMLEKAISTTRRGESPMFNTSDGDID
jgi:hypothetical protein